MPRRHIKSSLDVMKHLPAARAVSLFSIGTVITTILYLYASSADGIVVSPEGAVQRYANVARSVLQGDRFWREQLNIVKRTLEWALSLPERQARREEQIEKLDKTTRARQEYLYQRTPRARSSPAEERAEALLDEADRIEQVEIDQRLERYRSERIDNLQFTIQVLQMRPELSSSQVPNQLRR